jgi:hypothetical protein
MQFSRSAFHFAGSIAVDCNKTLVHNGSSVVHGSEAVYYLRINLAVLMLEIAIERIYLTANHKRKGLFY